MCLFHTTALWSQLSWSVWLSNSCPKFSWNKYISEKQAPVSHNSPSPTSSGYITSLGLIRQSALMAHSSLASYQHIGPLKPCCDVDLCTYGRREMGTAQHSAAASEATGPGKILLQARITNRTDNRLRNMIKNSKRYFPLGTWQIQVMGREWWEGIKNQVRFTFILSSFSYYHPTYIYKHFNRSCVKQLGKTNNIT